MANEITKHIAAAAIASALAMLSPVAVSAATLDCPDTSPPRVAQGKNASTTSKTFVDVPNSEITFQIDPGLPCMILEFSAKASAPAPQVMRVRVSVIPVPDDQRAATDAVIPATMDFSTATATSDGRATTFIIKSPVAGVRTLKLQFLSVKGDEVTLDSWMAILRYQKAS